MEDIDVDEIVEVNYPDPDGGEESVEVLFKDGTTKVFRGPELPQVLEMLNHWTPPTA